MDDITTCTCISNCFDQARIPDVVSCSGAPSKSGKSEGHEAEVKYVTEYYASDLYAYQAKTLLQSLSQTAASKLDKIASIADVSQFFKDIHIGSNYPGIFGTLPNF